MGKTDQFYAVARGKQVGIYRTWNECKAQVEGFNNARFKKFASEAEARQFVAQNMSVAGSSSTTTPSRKRKVQDSEGPPAKKAEPEELGEFSDAPVVFTDGACSSNGQKNAKAGWGVFWGDEHEDNAHGPVYGAPTNNRGELIAVEKALEKAIEKKLEKVVVKTDSKLLIESMTKWIGGWKRKGWKTATGSDVLNQDVLKKIDKLMGSIKVKFIHVRGHVGIYGNEKADELARKGAQMFKN